MEAIRLDVQALLSDFVQSPACSLASFKAAWLGRGMTFLHDGLMQPAGSHLQHAFQEALAQLLDERLEMQIGAIFTLFCLYETQHITPPVPIFLTPDHLSSLLSLSRSLPLRRNSNSIPAWEAAGALRALWDARAFRFGAANPRLETFSSSSSFAGDGVKQMSGKDEGLVRAARFHLATNLKGIADVAELDASSRSYAAARQHLFVGCMGAEEPASSVAVPDEPGTFELGLAREDIADQLRASVPLPPNANSNNEVHVPSPSSRPRSGRKRKRGRNGTPLEHERRESVGGHQQQRKEGKEEGEELQLHEELADQLEAELLSEG
eukprot:jgi/Chlat1/6687/Chrsp49S06166